ncbi:MAG: translation initiation factor IF-5A [Candidatus Methanomethylophilaceae archaeon]|jgi:translation initiation factor 5A|nr:translation initiation factor IF-5A [Thermoplasmata archaeon]MBR3476151.1 translation initiation factor IF-5A [Candidatus Methanomethylophilaceae archaeon]MBR4181624.1 translation initiation factor IF-5A [Candidatus Methanomethylophilaceae archaeon]MBR4216653.1 translation initiation factor IF-5A [Candidatus Methanomethylophilaceae archaeon]
MWEMKEIRELKEGRYVNVDEEPCKIVKITTSKPGKHGSAKANIDAVSIFTGAKKSIVGPVSTKVQVPMIDKRKGQILSISDKEALVMDMETFEQLSISINDDAEQKIEEGAEVLYLVAMGRYKFM